ncbi:MAG: plasmid partitioning protein RepB [Pseudomonadota bacterium]
MARKNLLKGLMDEGKNARKGKAPETKSTPPAPRPRATGAVGAVSQTFADLKARAIIDITADQIDDAGLKDRLQEDPEAHEKLKASLAEYGQQVPVLVRPAPSNPDRYEIVYGRRRVAALADLGLPIKALLRDLDDAELVMAQGQENSARRDLSFIEKANFANQMVKEGFERKLICDALHVDKTVISRMLQVTENVPLSVIRYIGAAHSLGRDRWLKLAEAIAGSKDPIEKAVSNIRKRGKIAASEDRFAALLEYLEAEAKPPAPPRTTAKPIALTDSAGGSLGVAKKTPQGTKLDLRSSDGFSDWLIANLSQIHAQFKRTGGE